MARMARIPRTTKRSISKEATPLAPDRTTAEVNMAWEQYKSATNDALLVYEQNVDEARMQRDKATAVARAEFNEKMDEIDSTFDLALAAAWTQHRQASDTARTIRDHITDSIRHSLTAEELEHAQRMAQAAQQASYAQDEDSQVIIANVTDAGSAGSPQSAAVDPPTP